MAVLDKTYFATVALISTTCNPLASSYSFKISNDFIDPPDFSEIFSFKFLPSVADEPSFVVKLLSIISRTDSVFKVTPFTFDTASFNAFFRASSYLAALPFEFISM